MKKQTSKQTRNYRSQKTSKALEIAQRFIGRGSAPLASPQGLKKAPKGLKTSQGTKEPKQAPEKSPRKGQKTPGGTQSTPQAPKAPQKASKRQQKAIKEATKQAKKAPKHPQGKQAPREEPQTPDARAQRVHEAIQGQKPKKGVELTNEQAIACVAQAAGVEDRIVKKIFTHYAEFILQELKRVGEVDFLGGIGRFLVEGRE